jgi:hypothetical protein
MPRTLVATASAGKYSHVGLLESGSMDDEIGLTHSGWDRCEVSDITNAETQQLPVIPIDDLIHRVRAVQVVEAHVVLLGLVT